MSHRPEVWAQLGQEQGQRGGERAAGLHALLMRQIGNTAAIDPEALDAHVAGEVEFRPQRDRFLLLGLDGREHAPLGVARTYGDGADLTLVSWANGLWMSLRAARVLEAEHGIKCRVVDLRWILPLPVDDLVREASATGRVLVVDECRATGGVSEAVYTALIDAGVDAKMARVAGADVYVPLAGAANLVLVQEAEIIAAALALVSPSAPPLASARSVK